MDRGRRGPGRAAGECGDQLLGQRAGEPFVTWGTRIERYVRALASGDPDQVQTALNAGFGECFTPAAGRDALDWQEILQRRAPYRMKEVPDGVLRLGMGVDVQKLSLYYTIRGFGARGRSWLIDRGSSTAPPTMTRSGTRSPT
jgi:phage terminase large subunit GpA-like protein